MPLVTVSSKYQITLPMEVVRALDIQPGEKLVLDVIDDRIVAIRQPESWISYIRGSAHGLYGETKPQVDRYVAEERAGWDVTPSAAPVPDVESFVDYYIENEGTPTRSLIDALASSAWPFALTAEEIIHQTKLSGGQIVELVHDGLSPRGWVKSIPAGQGRVKYRLHRDLADEIHRTPAA
jgi:AbrB family looped-hinge helix DNA binding protein